MLSAATDPRPFFPQLISKMYYQDSGYSKPSHTAVLIHKLTNSQRYTCRYMQQLEVAVWRAVDFHLIPYAIYEARRGQTPTEDLDLASLSLGRTTVRVIDEPMEDFVDVIERFDLWQYDPQHAHSPGMFRPRESLVVDRSEGFSVSVTSPMEQLILDAWKINRTMGKISSTAKAFDSNIMTRRSEDIADEPELLAFQRVVAEMCANNRMLLYALVGDTLAEYGTFPRMISVPCFSDPSPSAMLPIDTTLTLLRSYEDTLAKALKRAITAEMKPMVEYVTTGPPADRRQAKRFIRKMMKLHETAHWWKIRTVGYRRQIHRCMHTLNTPRAK